MMRHGFLTPLAVSMFLIVLGPSAGAQEQPTDEDLIQQYTEMSFEGEVTVTGSLIPRGDLTALSPVTVMEVPTELTYSGTVRIEDLVRTMPQVFAGQNSTISNGATGTASIQLRNLGAHRTLVLINGRRMAYGDALGADLNSIPAPLVKRVDVLTGGASTVYGSDAMAGVVNFIMDTDFTGVRGGLQYSFYNHNNNNDYAQELNREAGFDPPTGWINDGNAINGNIALGGEFADGKGHAMVYLDYRKVDSLTKAARDYIACEVSDSATGPLCGGSSTTERGTFWTFNAGGAFTGIYTMNWLEDGGDGHSFRPWAGELWNYGPYNHIQRPDENYNAGAFANYEINKHFDVYMEVMYMNNYSEAQIAPSGSFMSVDRINCDNPMLSEQQRDIICTQGGYGPEDYAAVWIRRRNVEGGPRFDQIGHTNSRLVGGLRGDIDDSWSYDFYGLHAEANAQSSYVNDLSIDRVRHAVDVIEDPDTGEWVCRDPRARANGCVPWNIFQEGAVDLGAIDYMSAVAVGYRKTTTEVINLTFNGDLESYGVVIPSASEGLQLAVGAEYRSEWLRNVPDEIHETGGTTGGIGGALRFADGFNVKELYLEALVPVVQDVRGARDLSLELGYRYSDYSTSGGFNTYKALLNWAISDSWRLRGGFNRAVRVPNLRELYEPLVEGWSGYVDLCEGENPAATFERCARTGVTSDQYGNIPAIPPEIAQSNALYGGNPLLDPEVGDTFTAGLVWTPAGIHGLSVTLDYYNIKITEAIGGLTAETIHRVCMETDDPSYCDLIHRDAHGSIWLSDEGYTELINQNVGQLGAEGIDLNANYLIGLGGAGYLATDLMGTYILAQNLSSPEFDFECAGFFGLDCGSPKSRWRHRFRATWESNFRLNLSLAWRYLGSAEIDRNSPYPYLSDSEWLDYARLNLIDTVRAYNWFDLAASYTFRSGVKLTLGVNNILDEEPPLMPGLAGSRGTWFNLYGNYDPLGRYVFGSVQFNF